MIFLLQLLCEVGQGLFGLLWFLKFEKIILRGIEDFKRVSYGMSHCMWACVVNVVLRNRVLALSNTQVAHLCGRACIFFFFK